MVIIPGIDSGALFEQQPRDLRGTSKMQWVPPVAAGRADECGLTPQHLAQMGLQTKTSGRVRRQFGTPSDEGRSYRRIYPTQTKAGPPTTRRRARDRRQVRSVHPLPPCFSPPSAAAAIVRISRC